VKNSFKVGLSFGTTSGVITTLGLIVGLYTGTGSQLAVIGGILTIAVADAFSDSVGIHISEESKGMERQSIWEAMLATFVFKLVVALSFAAPVLLLPIEHAVLVSVLWGLGLLAALSYYIAKENEPWKAVFEHLIIATAVIIVSHQVGLFVKANFA
jgi:vacuolar iron transporter family protein